MLRLDDLRRAVDLYDGSLRFPVPLAALPGLGGPDYTLRLTYDSATVDETVGGWNLDRPTGVAGLGWRLEVDRIDIYCGDPLGSDEARSDPEITLRLDGRDYTLLATGPGAYAVKPYRFWQVTYAPGTETWTVVLEDGTRLIFGDAASGRATVDWGYAWGNWSGAGLSAAGRSRVAVGWSLSEIIDLWGHRFSFSYRQVEGSLGVESPVPYTRATYLERVEGPLGGHLTLTYTDKEAVEYQDPFGGPAAAARQSRFETRALATVEETAAGGAVLATTTLDYTAPGGGVATIGEGDRTKRLLMGIGRRTPDACSLPGLTFAYDTDAASPSYGALLTVTTAAGGTARLAYARPALTLPRRDAALAPPAREGVTYDRPRVFFGRDYTVVLWRGSDDTAAAGAYRWEGRWLRAAVAAPTTADAAAYDRLQVVIGEECFAIVGDTDYTLFHTDPRLPGGWIGSQAPEPTGLPAGEPAAVAAGRGYVALMAGRSGTLICRWFDGSTWQTSTFPAPDGTRLAALDGTSQVLARLSSTGGPTHDLLLMHPDPAQGWRTQDLSVECDLPGLDGLTLRLGHTFGLATFAASAGDGAATCCALRWSADFATVKTTQLRHLTATPPAVQLRGATVLIGEDLYRFDGADWRHQDLSTMTHPHQLEVAGLSLGGDVVTRAVTLEDGSLVYDLITYNAADTSEAPWSYAPGFSGVPAKEGTATTAMTPRFGPGRPDAAGRLVLFNNQLQLLGGDGGWSRVLDIAAVFTPGTIAGLLLFAGNYLVYQTADGVTAYPLRPGGPATGAAGIQLPGTKLLADGRPLAGETAFVAYSGTWGEPGATLTLHRPLTGDIQGSLSPLTVRSLTLYGGNLPAPEAADPPYNAVARAYSFDAATATVSPDGRRLRANRTTAVPGAEDPARGGDGRAETYFFNGLSAAEPPARPYPEGSDVTNAGSHLTMLQGLPYCEQTFAQGAADPDSRDTSWWWTTVVPAGGRFVAAYSRPRREEEALCGVPLQRTMTYAPETGLAARVETTAPDGRLIRVDFTRWWEKYDAGRTLNLLTPVVQRLETVDGGLIRGTVTTWKGDWVPGETHWAPRATYVAVRPDPAAWTAWTGDPSPLPEGWMLAEAIEGRSAAGTVLATADALGSLGSSLTDRDGRRRIAAFAGGSVAGQEASHYGCEPYEAAGPWQYTGGTIEEHIVAGGAHLGTRCLEITPDTAAKTGPTAAWTPRGQERSYLFSCWVRTEAGFGPPSAAAQWEITVQKQTDPPAPLGDPITLPIPATEGEWQYLSAVVPLGDLRQEGQVPPATEATITVKGYNQKEGRPVYVDGLKFQPLDASFHAVALDPATGLSLGSLGLNGLTERYIRDVNRLIRAVVGPDETRARLRAPAFARLMSTDGGYRDALPNMLLEAATGAAAVYEDFRASHAGRWSLPEGWTMADGRLAFSGTATPPRGSRAVLQGQHGDYAAGVRFRPADAETPPNVGIGCGNVLAYHDAQAGNWVLTCSDGSAWRDLATRPGTPAGGDLTFSILDGRATLFAAGQQVFSAALPDGIEADGSFGLCLTGDGTFEDLVVLPDPRLSLRLVDGRGMPQQVITLLDGGRVAARGLVTDGLGRAAYDKNPVALPLVEDDRRIAGGTADYLPPVAGRPQTLEHYLALGNGSPFERTSFTASPLTCPQQRGLPGDPLAIGGGHATSVALTRNSAGGPLGDLVPAEQAGNYNLTTLIDPDGTPVYALTPPLGGTVARRVALGTGETLTYGYEYDAAGRLTAVRPPNDFAAAAAGGGASGDGSADARRTTCVRDFLGRITAVTTPDSGTTRFAYDSRGRLRFRLDACGAAATPPRITYCKYDVLDRPLETGTVQHSSVDWAAAQAQADNPAWPGGDLSPVIARSLTYDAPDRAPGSLGGTFVEGRLWRAEVNRADGTPGVRETLGYDRCGNITDQWLEAPDYDGAVRATTLAYDGRDCLIGVDYPRAVGDDPPLRVRYAYDRLGRLSTVGEPEGGTADRYARLTYNADGTVAAIYHGNGQGHPSEVSYTYNAAGWPLQVASPVYTEAIGYLEDGYIETPRHGGQVSWIHRTWRRGADSLYPLLDYRARLGYDPAGRPIAATPYMDGGGTGGRGDRAAGPDEEAPLRYDPDGNLLSVRRGGTVAAYAYPAAAANAASSGDTPPPSGRLQSVTGTLAAGCDFEGPPPAGWRWGTTSGGPGGPTLVDGGPQGSGRCLQLPGGAAGTAGFLEYRGYVDPRGQYTLTFWVKADEAFAAQKGFAGWCLSLLGPAGPAVTLPLESLTDAPASWTQRSVTIDLRAQLADHALWSPVVEVSLRLINDRRGDGPGFGAALQVDDVALFGSGTGTVAYDDLGRVTALPGAGLSQLAYVPDADEPVSLVTAADGGFSLSCVLNRNCLPAVRTATPTGEGTPSRALVLRLPDGTPLARLESRDGAERRQYFVAGGPQGIFAVEDDGRTCYVIRDHAGDIRATVDEQGRLIGHSDSDAFGRVQQASGAVPVPPEAPDPLTGLEGNRNPELGTTLTPQGAGTIRMLPPPEGAYTDPLIAGRLEVGGPAWYEAIKSQFGEEFAGKVERYRTEDAPRWREHNRAGWKESGMTEEQLWPRFFKYKRISDACRAAGMLGTGSHPLAEDMFHLSEYYATPEAAGGKRLQPRAVDPIPPGYYIYVVNKRDEFLYRNACDREEGFELYVRHSQLNGGDCAKSAGMFHMDDNHAVRLTGQSGHYQPEDYRVQWAGDALKGAGYNDVRVLVPWWRHDLKRELNRPPNRAKWCRR